MPIAEGMLTPEERSRTTADYAVLNGVVKALSAQNDILRARVDALENDRANDRVAYLELRDQVYELATPPQAVTLEVAQSDDPRIAELQEQALIRSQVSLNQQERLDALEKAIAQLDTAVEDGMRIHYDRIVELEKRAVFPHQHDEYEDVFERLRDDMTALAHHQHEGVYDSLTALEKKAEGIAKLLSALRKTVFDGDSTDPPISLAGRLKERVSALEKRVKDDRVSELTSSVNAVAHDLATMKARIAELEHEVKELYDRA